MLEKILFYSFNGLITIVGIWVMFISLPVMIEIAKDALKLWKELL